MCIFCIMGVGGKMVEWHYVININVNAIIVCVCMCVCVLVLKVYKSLSVLGD